MRPVAPDDAPPPEAVTTRAVFADLGLSEPLLRAVEDAGYRHPTPIQEQAIPIVLMGRDVLGCAQTGTGRTAGFTLPMMDILAGSRAKARMPRSLILEPTRELALQVAEQFEKYGKHLKLNHALLIGGESMNDQRDVLEKGVDVLIATPGRLLDLFERGRILLADCKVLVIDEADRMLDMGFIPDVERIVSLLPRMRQTLFFSATMAPEIRRLADAFLQNPKEITVSAPATVATTITAGLAYVQPHDKREALRRLIRSEDVQNALIFCNRKVDVDILYKSLKRHKFSVGALHGDMDQSTRFATLNAFKAGEIRLLVCSDVAARGLDIGGLSHVFNFDVPIHAEDYVHRIGRTGRAGREGHAYTIATADDIRFVQAIEKLTGKPIPPLVVEGLDPVTEEEIAEAAASPRRGRGRGNARKPDPRRGGREAAPRRDGGERPRRESRSRDEAAPAREEAPVREDRPRRERREEALRREAREERPRRDDRRREERPREAAPAEERVRDHAPREARREDHRRDEPRRDRGRRDRDDPGPAVRGFGDAVPAFMLIAVPRARRGADSPAEAEAA
ncbi:MAG TPA: DEAD/DEAH box helicase [Acetobacteraceae bacterium]|nr:DEAD/DEAH box helicase [Acetobacteraceae bacterium]